MFLIAGLGNPEDRYTTTRHNIGFTLVDALAERFGFPFKRESKLKGYVAKGMVGDKTAILLKPTTYMNLSGSAIRTCMNYYKIDLSELLVVTDDVEIPLGKIRIREKGGTGGHNGLKDIEKELGTSCYARLRLGVGRDDRQDLSSFVLARFKDEEKQELQTVLEQGEQAVLKWLDEGVIAAARFLGQIGEKNATETKSL